MRGRKPGLRTGNCACGAPIFARRMCKTCYMRTWRQENPEYFHSSHAQAYERERQNMNINKDLGDLCDYFCKAFDCTHWELAHYYMALRKRTAAQ